MQSNLNYRFHFISTRECNLLFVYNNIAIACCVFDIMIIKILFGNKNIIFYKFTCSHGQVNILISKKKELISVFVVAVICSGKWSLCNSYGYPKVMEAATLGILWKYAMWLQCNLSSCTVQLSSCTTDKKTFLSKFQIFICFTPGHSSSAKFDSGTGWPSFHSAIEISSDRATPQLSVAQKRDNSHGMVRVEVLCQQVRFVFRCNRQSTWYFLYFCKAERQWKETCTGITKFSSKNKQ